MRKLRIPRRWSPAAVAVVLLLALWEQFGPGLGDGRRDDAARPAGVVADARGNDAAAGGDSSDRQLAAAFRDRRNDLQIAGAGTVVHVLPDDNDGSRHQRFLLELDSGQTLLVAHNIDLAPRIPQLARGDRVRFFGEYEWNAKGGVIHWTHHDPRGNHVGGWLEHDGRRYE